MGDGVTDEHLRQNRTVTMGIRRHRSQVLPNFPEDLVVEMWFENKYELL